MSAFWGKADMAIATRDVRLWPLAASRDRDPRGAYELSAIVEKPRTATTNIFYVTPAGRSA